MDDFQFVQRMEFPHGARTVSMPYLEYICMFCDNLCVISSLVMKGQGDKIISAMQLKK